MLIDKLDRNAPNTTNATTWGLSRWSVDQPSFARVRRDATTWVYPVANLTNFFGSECSTNLVDPVTLPVCTDPSQLVNCAP